MGYYVYVVLANRLLQIIRLKKKYSDALLMVEVGYKYRFFGEDARVRFQHRLMPSIHFTYFSRRSRAKS